MMFYQTVFLMVYIIELGGVTLKKIKDFLTFLVAHLKSISRLYLKKRFRIQDLIMSILMSLIMEQKVRPYLLIFT